MANAVIAQQLKKGAYYRGKTPVPRQITAKGFSFLTWRSVDNRHGAANYPCDVFASWAIEEIPPSEATP